MRHNLQHTDMTNKRHLNQSVSSGPYPHSRRGRLRPVCHGHCRHGRTPRRLANSHTHGNPGHSPCHCIDSPGRRARRHSGHTAHMDHCGSIHWCPCCLGRIHGGLCRPEFFWRRPTPPICPPVPQSAACRRPPLPRTGCAPPHRGCRNAQTQIPLQGTCRALWVYRRPAPGRTCRTSAAACRHRCGSAKGRSLSKTDCPHLPAATSDHQSPPADPVHRSHGCCCRHAPPRAHPCLLRRADLSRRLVR
mmetsp:Transcript_28842/g.83275  ORF Transcript_28842/g.83275 Transcript_28842/m.83275 type:complete len:247 (+) Transcript_28842:1004-1744(+)